MRADLSFLISCETFLVANFNFYSHSDFFGVLFEDYEGRISEWDWSDGGGGASTKKFGGFASPPLKNTCFTPNPKAVKGGKRVESEF